MKFSIKSWSPIAWMFAEPLTKQQILCYDLEQRMHEIDEKLMDLALQEIKLEHEREGIVAQLEFINEGNTQPMVVQYPTVHFLHKE